jgi:uncharacterized coiled-coil DUF342 family protein
MDGVLDAAELQLQLLEAQQAHMVAVADLQRQLADRDAAVAALRAQPAAATAGDEIERGRLRAQLELLSAKLADAEDRYDELYEATGGDELRAQLARLKRELASAAAQRDAAAADARRATEELVAMRPQVAAQQGSLHALRERLDEVLSRATTAEAQLAELRPKLDKRDEQVAAAAAALRKLRDRDAESRAAVSDLTRRLEEAQREGDRSRQVADVLQGQQRALSDRVEALRERVAELEAARAADADAVSRASTTAQALGAATANCDVLRRERDALARALETARADARRESAALQRLADERQRLVGSLQADLSAATSALRTIGGAAGAGAAPAPGRPQGGYSSSSSAASDRARPLTTAALADVSGSGGSNSTGVDSAGGYGGASNGTPSVVDFVQLRLQCESLSRKLGASLERVRELERDQDELVATNERLRRALQQQQQERQPLPQPLPSLPPSPQHSTTASDTHASLSLSSSSAAPEEPLALLASGGGTGATAASPTQSPTSTATLVRALVADVQRSEGLFADVRTLLLTLSRLFTLLSARHEWRSAHHQPLSAAERFGAVAAALALPPGSGAPAASSLSSLKWSDVRSLELDVRSAAAAAETVHREVSDGAAADVGRACQTQ